METNIKNILKYAVNAPSGNNSQPWRFEVSGNKIYIYNLSARDRTPYNFRQRGSYFAHGALIENIEVVSSHYGYEVRFELFPDNNNPELISVITLEKTGVNESPLYEYLAHRATNRRNYKITPLKNEHREIILNTAKEFNAGDFVLIEDREKIKLLSLYLGLHERLIFENHMIHDIVFSRILWSAKEAEKIRMGLDIKTKFPDMPPFMLFFMRLFGVWFFIKIINKIGFAKKIHSQSAESCTAVSGICAILIDSNSNKNFLMAGRLFQRIWLSATMMGLSIQPVTGIPYLARRISAGESGGFSQNQINMIQKANENINNILDIKNKSIAMIFRIGYANKPPVKTLKLEPNIVFKE